jgi:hypothetical protein
MPSSWAWRGSGKPHGNSRLSLDLVKEIEEMRGRFSAAAVADMFDVGKSTVLDIWRKKTWRIR